VLLNSVCKYFIEKILHLKAVEEIKEIQTGMKDVKLPIFADDRILCLKDIQNSTKKVIHNIKLSTK
jgi:hypothetical protein